MNLTTEQKINLIYEYLGIVEAGIPYSITRAGAEIPANIKRMADLQIKSKGGFLKKMKNIFGRVGKKAEEVGVGQATKQAVKPKQYLSSLAKPYKANV